MSPRLPEKGVFAEGLRTLELFFARPDEGGRMRFPEAGPARLLGGLFQALSQTESASGEAGAADWLNALLREHGTDPLRPRLLGMIFEAAVEHRVLPAELAADNPSPVARFLLEAAASLLYALGKAGDALPAAERRRVLPTALALLPEAEKRAELQPLALELIEFDRFRRDRSFRFAEGVFRPATVDSAKPPERFFGYPGARNAFREHFADFAAGKTNLPLLVSSLPGHGKTSMIISHILAHPELVLVLPEPAALEGDWPKLTAPLAARPDRRFAIFFDDIDPARVDWYNFRTHVGGAFSLPPNVMPVLAANYEFPASILSRGRRVTFPVFDEIRCMEMIEEFLATFGIRRTMKPLVSLIAADYAEEFGQKKFTELSPRSLVRYLSIYEHDRIKRKTMMELSLGEMITRPDAELFYEFNIELMRSLYGEAYIEKLRKEKLRKLG